MEIKMNPVSLEERIELLQESEPGRQATSPKFPWTIAIIFLAIGAGITVGFIEYRRQKEEKLNVSP